MMYLEDDLLTKGFRFAPESENGAAVADDHEPEVAADDPGTEPETEPVPEPEPTPEPEVDPNAELFSTLQAFGVPQDPQAVAAHLRNLQAQASQANQLRAMLWQLEQQKQQAPAAPSPKQDAAWKAPWGTVPDFDPNQLNSITADDLQNDLMLKKQYQQFLDWQRKGTHSLLSDPVGSLWGGFQPKVEELVNQLVQQRLQQTAQQQNDATFNSQVQQYYARNKEWLEDKITGQPTQWAWMWGNAIKQARQWGHPDPIKYAEDQIDAELFRWQQTQASQQPAPPTAPAAPANARMEFLKAKNKPSRAGSFARPNGKKSPPQNPAGVWDRLRTELEELQKHAPEDFKKEPGSSRN